MKPLALIVRPSHPAARLALCAAAALLAGCSGTDYSNYRSDDMYESSGSFSYGVGVYNSWGYYGNPYYGGGGGAIIVTPPRPNVPRPMPRMR